MKNYEFEATFDIGTLDFLVWMRARSLVDDKNVKSNIDDIADYCRLCEMVLHGEVEIPNKPDESVTHTILSSFKQLIKTYADIVAA